MNTEEVIDDLKQFIAATVSQATADMATKADLADLATKEDLADVRGEVTSLRSEMNQRFDDLDLQVKTIADAHAEMLDDHDQRLTRLEHRPV